MKHNSLTTKAMNALVCALSSNELKRVCNCSTAKDIWFRDYIERCKPSERVKNQSPHLLYKLFEMKNDETIKGMFSYFTNIVNRLNR